MNLIVRSVMTCALMVGLSVSAQANEYNNHMQWIDLDSALSTSDIFVADNRLPAQRRNASVPNIPDSAFEKPGITENNLHMYLGLASLAMGGMAAISAPEEYDADLLNTVHFKAAKASWQLGAAAIASGFYSHWDDFHLEDGLFDRDNLHVLLGLVGTLGYYLAVKGAVDEYNDVGYPSTDHASKGIIGGASMTFAIGFTW